MEKNLSIRHNVKPTHTLKELLLLKKLFPERIILFGAFYKQKMIAGVVTFVVTLPLESRLIQSVPNAHGTGGAGGNRTRD